MASPNGHIIIKKITIRVFKRNKGSTMKKTFLIVTFLLSLFSHSAYSADEILLQHRFVSECENDSCSYDFFEMKKGGHTLKMGFGMGRVFDDGSYYKNAFHASMIRGDLGLIIDLGRMSCKDIENEHESESEWLPSASDRVDLPMYWLSWTKAWERLNNGEGSQFAQVKKGHCYLMYQTNRLKKVVVAFRVKDFNSFHDVVLDEIEVFSRSEIKEVKLDPSKKSNDLY